MRYDAEHKQKTRERVLDAAAAAIRIDGPHRIGVAGLMAKAGLTHGGFYAHFPSKGGLVTEAIGAMFEQAAARFEAVAAGQSPSEALGAYLDFYLSASHRDSREWGCPLPTLSADLPRMDASSRERYGRGVAELTGRIAGLLAAMSVANPEDLAASMTAEMVGALALSRAVAEPEQSDRILARSRRALRRRAGLEAAE